MSLNLSPILLYFVTYKNFGKFFSKDSITLSQLKTCSRIRTALQSAVSHLLTEWMECSSTPGAANKSHQANY